jgi:hypothetical protein
MKTLWELTRGIAKIVDLLIGRMNRLEQNVSSQEQRLAGMEEKRDSSIHSMEVTQSEKVEREEARQDTLSDRDLRDELNVKYGSTKWAKSLINTVILGRRRKNEISH